MKSIVLLSIVVTIVSSVVLVSIPSVYGSTTTHLDQVNQNYESSLWKLGGTIQEGDTYQYKICSDKTILQVIYPYHCYNIELEFVNILESYKGKVWVVQGNFTTPEINRYMIF